MLNCSIAVADRNSMYVDQIIAGFTLLAKEKQLTFTLEEKPDLKKEFFHSAVIEVLVGGKRVIYDLTDGYNNYPSFNAIDNMLDNVDFYFRASFRESFHANMRNKDKIFVLAPRYHVTCKDSPLNAVNFKSILLNRDISEAKKLARKLPFFKTSLKNLYMDAFETAPPTAKDPKIFFYTRLWDPAIASSYSSQNTDLDGFSVEERIERKREEYAKISELRSGLVRALKKEFGSHFIGGVVPDDFSQKYCPDLLGSENLSKRKNYTKQMHSAQICVNTQGTHNCWNFSFGEELAASRAIITEQPFYLAPVNLIENRNFYTYDSIDSCIEKVNRLFTNGELLSDMMQKNREYYLNHLRPDSYVKDTLEIILR